MNVEINKYSEIDRSDPLLRKAIHIAFDGRCFYTGRDVAFNEMHIDHIYPESKGGKNCISNYVLSCQHINFIKNDRVYDSLINVSKEVVDAMFSEKVVNIYNDLVSNKSIIDGYVELNEYLNELNFNSHALIGVFRSYVCSVLIPIRIYPISKKFTRGKKAKLYFNKEEIDNLLISWKKMRERFNR
jgi:hypothetical protein